jgi:hypothetical protein
MACSDEVDYNVTIGGLLRGPAASHFLQLEGKIFVVEY